MAKVSVWETQLRSNDFPPICAVTGKPAEMWRRFKYTSVPAWAHLFGWAGFAFESRTSGYLPLTRAASKRITLIRVVLAGTIPLSILLWLAGGLIAPPNGDTDSTRDVLTGALILGGILMLMIAIVALMFGFFNYGPKARISDVSGQRDRLVELRGLHPAFVAAVKQLQAQRAAQLQAAQPVAPARPPESPFPPGKFSF